MQVNNDVVTFGKDNQGVVAQEDSVELNINTTIAPVVDSSNPSVGGTDI